MTTQRIELGRTTAPASGCGCGCGSPATAARADDGAAATMVVRVEGMTCDHCVRAVTSELRALDGVTGVEIDLRVGDASVVRIAATGPLDESAVAAAVDEAGYTLAP